MFSPSAWLVLAASLVCVGAAMWLVDGSHNDLEVVAEHRDRKTLHSVTTSVSFVRASACGCVCIRLRLRLRLHVSILNFPLFKLFLLLSF